MIPIWAVSEPLTQLSTWRFHWEQNCYYAHTPLDVVGQRTYFLESYHDDHQIWFRPTTSATRIDFQRVRRTKEVECRCGLHKFDNPYRTGMMNDDSRNRIFLQSLRNSIRPGKSICLCISDDSLLPLMAIKLGAKHVFVLSQNLINQAQLRVLVRQQNVTEITFVTYDRINFMNNLKVRISEIVKGLCSL